ncbi:cytochrome c3 family protein [Desulfotignum phosphitoxidans]|uniref:Uncharacterized protein n=1 Tax=Desulfotignum phosphitoxidans DSM 13687 TaxID=1286635 RepID=S0G660_9BACT|nr:cytochrome c3 family protein [Desulfotignum phosphitoxidans]EMS81484.1 hypothetical protein, cytochrome c554 family [Desulfotignum phosphitoxidans DSM 13687]
MKISIISAIIFTTLIVHIPWDAYGLDGTTAYTGEDCFECHDEMVEDHAVSVHSDILCLECHTQALEEDHEALDFDPVNCVQCHAPHTEKNLHDAHTRVTCKACHVQGGIPTIDPESKNIIFSGGFRPGMEMLLHQAINASSEEQCGECHFQGNAVGASTMVLPAKSILCMPCHVATISVEDKTSLVSLFIFIIGVLGLVSVWFSGSIAKREPVIFVKNKTGARFKSSALFGGGIFHLLNEIFVEAILLKRLFQQSKARWIIHSLIFFPFVFRFAFSLVSLFFSTIFPDSFVTIALLDKNHVFRALFFDVTGLMILAGCTTAMINTGRNQGETIDSLPKPGRGMTAMIGLIVLVGFILEGMRIAMTGWPNGSQAAFAGYGISLLCKDMMGLNDIYGYVWYAHAILTAVFIALIPFTRMRHIITAPIVLVINSVSRNRISEKDRTGKREI